MGKWPWCVPLACLFAWSCSGSDGGGSAGSGGASGSGAVGMDASPEVAAETSSSGGMAGSGGSVIGIGDSGSSENECATYVANVTATIESITPATAADGPSCSNDGVVVRYSVSSTEYEPAKIDPKTYYPEVDVDELQRFRIPFDQALVHPPSSCLPGLGVTVGAQIPMQRMIQQIIGTDLPCPDATFKVADMFSGLLDQMDACTDVCGPV